MWIRCIEQKKEKNYFLHDFNCDLTNSGTNVLSVWT